MLSLEELQKLSNRSYDDGAKAMLKMARSVAKDNPDWSIEIVLDMCEAIVELSSMPLGKEILEKVLGVKDED